MIELANGQRVLMVIPSCAVPAGQEQHVWKLASLWQAAPSCGSEAAPHPIGLIALVGDLSRDRRIEVVLEAHRRDGLAARPAQNGAREDLLDLPVRVDLRATLHDASVIGLKRPNAVRLSSSRPWPSAGQSARPPEAESSTWWTTG
jgi:hypothetical protein